MAYGNLHYKGEPYRSSAYRDPFGTEDTHVRTHTNTHTHTDMSYRLHVTFI